MRLAFVALAAALLLVPPTDASSKPKHRRSKPPPALTADGRPNVQAASAIVLEPATGAIYYAKNPDEIRFIASMTKIFVAILVRRLDIDLDAATQITRVDRDYARGGARTRLSIDWSYKNIDLLRAMLIASDNRAPTALGRAVGLDANELVAKLDLLVQELGFTHTSFTSPNGLRGNQSTAREMAMALEIAMQDPVLAEIMSTRDVRVRAIHGRGRPISYHNTNRTLGNPRYRVTGGKTGFTDDAGYCLVTAADIAGHHLVFTFMGTQGKLTRFADFFRVADWLVAGGFRELQGAQVGRSVSASGSL